MMKKRALGLIFLVLAACNKQPDAVNDAAPDVTATATGAMKAGLYRQATTLIDLKDPSMAAEEAAAAAKAVGTTQTADRCVTPAMVDDPKAIMADSMQTGCTAQKSVWENGKIDVALNCPETAERAGGTMQLGGTYGPDAYAIDMIARDLKGGVMRLKVDAKRIGDCPKQ